MKKRLAKKILHRILREELNGKWPAEPVLCSQVKTYQGDTYIRAAKRWNRACCLNRRIRKKKALTKAPEWSVTTMFTTWSKETPPELATWIKQDFKFTADAEVGAKWEKL